MLDELSMTLALSARLRRLYKLSTALQLKSTPYNDATTYTIRWEINFRYLAADTREGKSEFGRIHFIYLIQKWVILWPVYSHQEIYPDLIHQVPYKF